MNMLERLALIVPLVLLPAFGAEVANTVLLYRERHEDVRKLAQARADVYNTELDETVTGLGRLLSAVAQFPSVNSLQSGECDRTLQELARGYPHDVVLAAADLSGKVVCSSLPHPAAVSIADRPFFSRARAGFTVGGYLRSRLTGNGVLPFAAPLRDGPDQVGVVAAFLSLDWLARNLQRPVFAPGQSLIVTDGDGIILADLPQGRSRVGDKVRPEYLATMRARLPGVVELDDDQGRPTIYGYVPVTLPPSNLYLLFGVDRNVAFAPIYTAAWRSISLGLISVVLALLIAWIVGVRFVRRPIERLTAAAQAWRNGNYAARAELREGPEELRYLGAAFDGMADALRARDTQLANAIHFKDMILAAAGHDLRQPLQIVLAAIHGLSRRSLDLSEKQHVERAQRAVQRLTDELDMLINVARMRDKSLRMNREAFSAEPFLKEAAARWSGKVGEKGLRLVVRPIDAVIVSDPMLLRTIVDNLLGNAIKYTDHGGILLGCRRRASDLWIEIYDTGVGIPKDRIASIFEEFQQLDPQRGGFGLGLWIVRAAADALGHQLCVRSSPGRGSRFRVVVPLRKPPLAATGGKSAA